MSGTWTLKGEACTAIGIDNVLTIERDSSRWYYHHDGLGSVTELTDADGALAQAYEYDAWGNATIYDPDSAIANPYLYTGREWDADIGLYYYRARHYAPQLGRFIQPDPIGNVQWPSSNRHTRGLRKARPRDGEPNLYLYARDNPITFVDPFGLYISEWRQCPCEFQKAAIRAADAAVAKRLPRVLGEVVAYSPLYVQFYYVQRYGFQTSPKKEKMYERYYDKIRSVVGAMWRRIDTGVIAECEYSCPPWLAYVLPGGRAIHSVLLFQLSR